MNKIKKQNFATKRDTNIVEKKDYVMEDHYKMKG